MTSHKLTEDRLTRRMKIMLYNEGKYRLGAPPTYWGNWTVQDWVDYIDYTGEWIIDYDNDISAVNTAIDTP